MFSSISQDIHTPTRPSHCSSHRNLVRYSLLMGEVSFCLPSHTTSFRENCDLHSITKQAEIPTATLNERHHGLTGEAKAPRQLNPKTKKCQTRNSQAVVLQKKQPGVLQGNRRKTELEGPSWMDGYLQCVWHGNSLCSAHPNVFGVIGVQYQSSAAQR